MLWVKSLSRSFTALTVQGLSFSRPVRPSIASTFLFFKSQNLHRPSLTSLSLSSSSFHPPEPPAFIGQPVFNNIPLSEDERSDDAKRRTEDEGAVFVVTGASRGIGLEMVKQLLDRTKGSIVACCRSPQKAHKLHEFIETIPEISVKRIVILSLDLEDQKSITNFSNVIKSNQNRVDILFNVAGILGDGQTVPGPERSIRSMDREWMMKSMSVNYAGPVMMCQALAPMMRSKNVKKEDGSIRPKSIICNLSARVGSISDNELGGWYSYRSSKAALNQATRAMAHELKRQGTLALCLHPGTTDTDLSQPFQSNVKDGRLFPVEFTVGRLIDAVECMKDEHSGGLYDWAGKALPF